MSAGKGAVTGNRSATVGDILDNETESSGAVTSAAGELRSRFGWGQSLLPMSSGLLRFVLFTICVCLSLNLPHECQLNWFISLLCQFRPVFVWLNWPLNICCPSLSLTVCFLLSMLHLWRHLSQQLPFDLLWSKLIWVTHHLLLLFYVYSTCCQSSITLVDIHAHLRCLLKAHLFAWGAAIIFFSFLGNAVLRYTLTFSLILLYCWYSYCVSFGVQLDGVCLSGNKRITCLLTLHSDINYLTYLIRIFAWLQLTSVAGTFNSSNYVRAMRLFGREYYSKSGTSIWKLSNKLGF